MQWSDVELQAVQALLGILVAVLTAGIGYLAKHAKTYLQAHASAKNAEQANSLIDALNKIADATVQDLNQRVVKDAKANGLFTPELAQSVKEDAIASVKASLPLLAGQASASIGNVDALIASIVGKYVGLNHVDVTIPTVDNPQPTV